MWLAQEKKVYDKDAVNNNLNICDGIVGVMETIREAEKARGFRFMIGVYEELNERWGYLSMIRIRYMDGQITYEEFIKEQERMIRR